MFPSLDTPYPISRQDNRPFRRLLSLKLFGLSLFCCLTLSGSNSEETLSLYDDLERFQVFAETDPQGCIDYISATADPDASLHQSVHSEIFLAVAHRNLGQLEVGRPHAREALHLARESGQPTLRVRAKAEQAIYTYLNGNVDEAAGIIEVGLTLTDFYNLESEKSAMLNVSGILDWHRGDLPRALDTFQENARLNRQFGSPRRLHAALSNIGITLYRMGHYKRSIEAYEEALEVIDGMDLPTRRAAVLSNMGESYVALNDLELGKNLMLESLALERRYGTPANIAITLKLLGDVSSQQHAWEEAEGYYEDALAIQRNLPNRPWHAAATVQSIAQNLLQQSRFEEALELLNEAFIQVKTLQSYTLLRDFHRLFEKANQGLDNVDAALYHTKLAAHFDELAQKTPTAVLPQDATTARDQGSTPTLTKLPDNASTSEDRPAHPWNRLAEGGLVAVLAISALALLHSNYRLRQRSDPPSAS